MPELEPAERKKLVEMLSTKFSTADLVMMCGLDLQFEDVTFSQVINFGNPLIQIAFDIVTTAEKRTRLKDLLAAIRKNRPNLRDAEIDALYKKFDIKATAFVADPVKLNFAVGRFSQAFVDRQRLLRKLENLKELHDILHQLQLQHTELARLVKLSREPEYDPLDAGMTPVTLSNWLDKLTSQDQKRKWVRNFVNALKVIARCIAKEAIPVAEAERELEFLAKLPQDEQADLNEDLIDTARELDTAGLSEPLSELHRALPEENSTDFAQRYNQFQENCHELKRLTDEHDLCQSVDVAISEAVVLVKTPVPVFPRWDEMQNKLQTLAQARPGSVPADRLVKMVDRLAKSGPTAKPEWIMNLRHEFVDFFFQLDADLLDATDRVLHTADVIDFRLRGYAV